MFFSRKIKSYITVLDIGTSKVCGLMAHIGTDGKPEVIAVGHAPAQGIKAGAIIDLEKATECIGSVISQIEKQANHPVDTVSITISSTFLKSHHLSREVPIEADRPITATDVKHLVDSILTTGIPSDEEILLAIPLGYAVDKEKGIADPRGLYANFLKAYVHIVTIPENQLKNLVMVFDRCHVRIDRKIPTPYASALGALSEEEKDIGATVVDMGGGTTSYALFMNGGLVHLGLIPQGGNAITRDIAQVLSTSSDTAERLKTLNGVAFLSPRDELDRIIFPLISEENETNVQLPRADLIKIIIPRLEDILGRLNSQLNERETFSVATRRIVLCGGGALLQGIKEKTESILGANIRIAKINQIKCLPNQLDSYTFITCMGLLKYVLSKSDPRPTAHFDETAPQKSHVRKVLQWLVK